MHKIDLKEKCIYAWQLKAMYGASPTIMDYGSTSLFLNFMAAWHHMLEAGLQLVADGHHVWPTECCDFTCI